MSEILFDLKFILFIYYKNTGCQCTADSDGQIEVMAECDHYDYHQYNDSHWYELIQIICILNLSVFKLNYLSVFICILHVS